MALLDEISILKQEGKTDAELSQILERRGYSKQDISNYLSQSQIKQAVAGYEPNLNVPSPIHQQLQEPYQYASQFQAQNIQETENLQPSLMQQENYPQEQYQQQYPQSPYPQDQLPQYQDQANYQYQQQSISSDTIAEIADQIVAEKIAKIKSQLQNITDMKTTTETKLSHLSDRLQRIEKIIDQLQISILQKVGEYLVSTNDLKKELHETQKSFATKSEHEHHKSEHHHKKEQHKHK